MHPRAFMRVVTFVMLASLMMSGVTSAQQAGLDVDSRAQLAAIPLTSAELPSGYGLLGEAFVGPNGEPASADVPAEFSDAGYIGTYLSVYEATDGSTISSFASMWTDASAAEVGFGLLEETGEGAAGEPLELGDGPAALSLGDDASDATFVVDRFVVGLGVTGALIEEEDLLVLASALEERAQTIADGEQPAGVNSALPAAVLDIRPIGTEVRAGYLSSDESEQLYGVSGSSLGGVQASWVSLVAIGDEASSYVAISLSAFESEDNAARVVDQADQLVPLTVDLQPVDGVSVGGANAVRGFQYASITDGEASGPDSFRVVAQVGSQVAVMDVQGAESVEAAQSAAVSLMEAQIACMGGSCQLPDVSFGVQ